jgi:hypothetical protein
MGNLTKWTGEVWQVVTGQTMEGDPGDVGCKVTIIGHSVVGKDQMNT